jgi:hypothetical protein
VLAGAPAFDAERLPVGPQALGRILREANLCLRLELEPRLLLLHTFDRVVMAPYDQLANAMNVLLEREGVLSNLTHVPIRLRPAPQTPQTPRRMPQAAQAAETAERPFTGWLGEFAPAPLLDGSDERAMLALLQELLTERARLLGRLREADQGDATPPASTGELLRLLDSAPRPPPTAPAGATGDLDELRQMLQAQLRQSHGRAVALSREDDDTFDLLALLYTHIEQEMRRDTPALGLLAHLQIPLLRLALQDRAFFVRRLHPARQVLNTVAESGAAWLDEDELDPHFAHQLQSVVEKVATQHHLDPNAFEAANRDLQVQLQMLARKAELAERRHVEAARGREKLNLAKRRAAEVIEEASRDRKLPDFVRALLNQAWTDALTLTLLRHGEDSEQWQAQLAATAHIVSARDGGGDPGLAARIEHALVQVGYHAEEAVAIAHRLGSGATESDDDASHDDIALKLRARAARLGEDAQAPKPASVPRTTEEQDTYEYLRTLPFGTWFEFIINKLGTRVRRRLSWYSPLTDHVLFVNQRGQRVDEQSLDSLARMVAHGQAQVVTAERGRLVDRAWHSVLNALRSFTRGASTEETAP